MEGGGGIGVRPILGGRRPPGPDYVGHSEMGMETGGGKKRDRFCFGNTSLLVLVPFHSFKPVVLTPGTFLLNVLDD